MDLDIIKENPAQAVYTYIRTECQRCHLGVRGRDKRGDMRDSIEKVGVCITCHQHIPVGSYTSVHKKSFHDQLMERT